MTSKEALEKLKIALVTDLEESPGIYDDLNITDTIHEVLQAETIGELSNICAELSWDVWAWTMFLFKALLDDTEYVGDVNLHWDT